MMSGICLLIPTAKADPCGLTLLHRSTECKVNFGGQSEHYQYTYQTINAISQPYIPDSELAIKRLHINGLTKHEHLQKSVGKLRGSLSKFEMTEIKIIGTNENIMATVS